MNFNDNIPTIFAKSLAEISNLIVKPMPGQNHHEYIEKMERLRAFQQMAVVASFEDAMIAYHGQEITEDQKEILKVIYKSTRPWMLGHVVGVLLDKLDGKMANKDFAESVRTIVDQLTKEGESNSATSKIKGLMVKLTEKAA